MGSLSLDEEPQSREPEEIIRLKHLEALSISDLEVTHMSVAVSKFINKLKK